MMRNKIFQNMSHLHQIGNRWPISLNLNYSRSKWSQNFIEGFKEIFGLNFQRENSTPTHFFSLRCIIWVSSSMLHIISHAFANDLVCLSSKAIKLSSYISLAASKYVHIGDIRLVPTWTNNGENFLWLTKKVFIFDIYLCHLTHNRLWNFNNQKPMQCEHSIKREALNCSLK